MKNNNMKTTKAWKAALLPLLAVLCATGILAVIGCSKNGPQAQSQVKKTIYTCVMHHQIRREQPGDCPICGMTLVPLEQVEGTARIAVPSAPKPEKKIKYWANPMHPEQRSNKPMKDEMGMDYVPVYEEGLEAPVAEAGAPPEIAGLAPVHITPYKAQLIDLKFTALRKAPITKTIYTNGRFTGGEGDFAALAGEFAAGQQTRPSGRYVVADIYALDLPFVKVGQKAFVTALSGSGPRVEGRVSYIYPYDQTQSRITRVRISLRQAPPAEIFANVAIEATTEPKLAVPSTAIMDTGTQRYVFVQTADGTFTPEKITTGFEGDDLWEVASGLKEGDQVVDGALYLVDADSKLKAAFSESK